MPTASLSLLVTEGAVQVKGCLAGIRLEDDALNTKDFNGTGNRCRFSISGAHLCFLIGGKYLTQIIGHWAAIVKNRPDIKMLTNYSVSSRRFRFHRQEERYC